MPTYKIQCEVSGGVTGHRVGFLKNADEVVVFTTREEAETEAKRLRRRTANNTRATFSYTVVEEGGR